VERRTILFVALSLAIWYAWLMVFPPPEPPPKVEPGTEQTTSSPAPSVVPGAAPSPSVPASERPSRTEHEISACGVRTQWASDGGFTDLTLPAFRAPYQVTALHSWVLGGFGEWRPYGDEPGPARILSDRAQVFAPGAGGLGNAPAALVGGPDGARGTTEGLTVEQRVVVVAATDVVPCHLSVVTTWTNPGGMEWKGPLWLSSHDQLQEPSGGMFVRYDTHPAATALIDGSVYTLSGYTDLTAPIPTGGPAGWFGIGDRYFAALAVPSEAHGDIVQTTRTIDGVALSGMHWVVNATLPAGGVHTESLDLFVGPKDLDVLTSLHEDLGSAVELGWFAFFARPLLWMLKLFHAAVGNWGLAIVLLTFTVKIVFFPLTQSAFRSGQAMQAIQPALAEIREKYADNQEELSRRTMELFRDNKVNPVGGCLPMILQIPVWIALYNVLLSSAELYQSEFLFLKDLSSIDPYEVLPVVVTALIMVQQSLTPMTNVDPAQARMLKLMPLFFGIFFFTLPSGLVVYIFVNTVLSVLQQWFIKRSFPAPAVPVVVT
jgi:YidC/Oxa1 family membrane protein insertase